MLLVLRRRVVVVGAAAFQRVNTAFQTLSDADKRAAYDQGVDVKSSRRGGGSVVRSSFAGRSIDR